MMGSEWRIDGASMYGHYLMEGDRVIANVHRREDAERIVQALAENTRLNHQLRQERERREAIQRKHVNLVEHTQQEYGSRQRLERHLDALLMVWCSGGCGNGVLRWISEERPRWWQHRPEVTEEIVTFAEHNTTRLRQWFESNKRRAIL